MEEFLQSIADTLKEISKTLQSIDDSLKVLANNNNDNSFYNG